MHTSLTHAMLTGASLAFLAISGAVLPSSSAQAGPLAVAPRQDVAPAALTQDVRYRGHVRAVTIRPGVRYARGGYYRRGYYNNGFFPAAALGLFAGALGAATWGATSAYCDPYYYTWNYCGGYGGSYYPAYYGGGYYPAYYGGGYYPSYYPAYRTRRVIYRNAYRPRVIYRNVYGPRVVRYGAIGPRTHLIGSRTFVRSGYTVRSGHAIRANYGVRSVSHRRR